MRFLVVVAVLVWICVTLLLAIFRVGLPWGPL